MSGPFAALPAVRAGCLLSVAIPARDESESIEPALEAFALQRGRDGRNIDENAFEVIVFANDCADDTAARARAFSERHPRLALHVVEASSAPSMRHVGASRRDAMNAAAARVLPRGERAIVATTDADTIVSPTWIVETMAELAKVEALGGRIVPAASGRNDNAAAACARSYALEHRYQYALVRIETLLDPATLDPWPRHGNHYGASFALRAATYRLIGGLPALPALEDLALYEALLRADVPFRHSLRVRVVTSGRRTSRVEGGYASHLRAIDDHVAGNAAYLVEHPAESVARYRGRRSIRNGDPRAAARTYGLPREAVNSLLRATQSVGSAIETIEREARTAGFSRRYPRVSIDVAIRTLEAYAGSFASAACPTRINA